MNSKRSKAAIAYGLPATRDPSAMAGFWLKTLDSACKKTGSNLGVMLLPLSPLLAMN
jgi:hypothetical protein